MYTFKPFMGELLLELTYIGFVSLPKIEECSFIGWSDIPVAPFED